MRAKDQATEIAFATYYKELRLTQAGYYKIGQEPPVMEPPLPQEWIDDRLLSRKTNSTDHDHPGRDGVPCHVS
jgi:hypothetical protein